MSHHHLYEKNHYRGNPKNNYRGKLKKKKTLQGVIPKKIKNYKE
jgi:hypothetical protein